MLLLRLDGGRGARALLVVVVVTLVDAVVGLAVGVALMDEGEALHLSEQVLELRVLVATVTAANVVEPADLAEEVV